MVRQSVLAIMHRISGPTGPPAVTPIHLHHLLLLLHEHVGVHHACVHAVLHHHHLLLLLLLLLLLRVHVPVVIAHRMHVRVPHMTPRTHHPSGVVLPIGSPGVATTPVAPVTAPVTAAPRGFPSVCVRRMGTRWATLWLSRWFLET